MELNKISKDKDKALEKIKEWYANMRGEQIYDQKNNPEPEPVIPEPEPVIPEPDPIQEPEPVLEYVSRKERLLDNWTSRILASQK